MGATAMTEVPASAAGLEREAPVADGKMGITIEAAVLSRAMSAAAKVCEARNTIPILSNVRLVADPIIGKLEVLTTDMDIEYRQRVPMAQESGQLRTTVNAGKLRDLVNAVPKGAQMRLTQDGNRLIVQAGRGRWVMHSLPADDFPSIEFAPQHRLPIEPASKIGRIIDRVLWSRETELARYYLNGPLWHGDNGKLRLVTTNGHTMPVITTDLNWPADAPEVILAPKFCTILKDLVGDGAGVAMMCWDAAKMRVEFGDVILTGKVIDGTFPDYRRVISPPVAEPVIVDPATLAEAVRRVKLLGSEKTRSVKVEYHDGKITLSHTSVDHGTATEEVPADCKRRPDTGFNASYLMEMLAAIGGDSVEIHQQDANAPTLFRRVVDDGAFGIVMPMRT
ncbi:MAG: DNA polymerase III subunit beta [Novosphingobium sp. 28-62-57]|uniref:DNA polymerase III subunit beta n=1 Tax=Novosphingobium sp. 28-62-57 TaxID=1970409 RepID=UPI000BCAFFE7|nr:DNA polymerase III subunit beta [Novosphingobium sp. 28-62-57]OYW50737.1 MAG: DNA polymerase III subunit beta [Novosphingobium sp. 12-62-10]OYZ07772.1 MAG: DNA polymerase III subunit beta [Novosphingobium sp. 28-62-57]HQS70675.1 DNA polymerase III subunit beta [Novosphingobium sp.]